MPRLLDAIPVLPVLDLAASIAFYEETLGFSCAFRADDYAGLQRDDVEIHLWRCEDPLIPSNSSLRVDVEEIDALHDACREAGIVHPHGALAMKPWGLREFTIRDPSGNCVVFSEPPEAA